MQSVKPTRNHLGTRDMNECVIHQALMISLARLAHFNNLLSEHFTRHCGLVVRNEGAARTFHAVSNAAANTLDSSGPNAAVLRCRSIGIVALTSACVELWAC